MISDEADNPPGRGQEPNDEKVHHCANSTAHQPDVVIRILNIYLINFIVMEQLKWTIIARAVIMRVKRRRSGVGRRSSRNSGRRNRAEAIRSVCDERQEL